MVVITSQCNHVYIGDIEDRDGDAVTVTNAYQVAHLDGSRVNEAWLACHGLGSPGCVQVWPRMKTVLIFGVTSIIGISRDVHVKIASVLREIEASATA